MAATDILRTVLELENNVTAPAGAAAKSIDELGDQADQSKRQLDDLGDEMFQLSGISAVFSKALKDTAGSPLQGLISGATSAGSALGGALSPMVSQVSAFLSGPGGLAVGAVAASAAIFAMAGAVGFLGQALSVAAQGFAAIAPFLGPLAGVAITAPFLEAAKSFDSNVRVFQAVLGSSERARQMTGFIENYGLGSAFGQTPLTDVSKTLLMGGQDVNRFLPVAETIGLFAGGTDEAMMGVSEVLRRLMGGQIADALGSEGVGRFGINKKMLQGAGATFDKGGRFQGDEADALAVLERLTQTNQAMKDIRQTMDGSISSITSNFWDAMNKNARIFGESMGKYVLPIITSVTEGLIRLSSSGAIEQFATNAARLLGLNGDIGSSFNNIAAGFLAMMETALAMAKNGFNALQTGLASLRPFLDTIQGALDAAVMLPAVGPFFAPAAAGFRVGRGAFDMASGALGRAFEGGEGGMSQFNARYDRYRVMLGTAKIGGAETAPTVGENQLAQVQEAQAESLAQIERNTRIMAESSVRNLIMGGGELGAMGVTPFEVSRMKGRVSADPIEAAVLNMVDAISLSLAQKSSFMMGR